MAKKKNVRKKNSASRIRKSANMEFHSWTFFIFLLFVLLSVMILLVQQKGINFFRLF